MAAQDLCALSDVRAALEIPNSDTSRDTLIQTLITAASDAIMAETDREFAPVTNGATRRFQSSTFRLSLAPYDLQIATTVTLHPESTSPVTLVASQDYQLDPTTSRWGTYTAMQFSAYLASLPSSRTPFAFGYALVDITGNWGFPTIPTEVARACIITVAAWMRKDVATLVGPEMDLAGGIAPPFPPTMEVPNAARALLTPFYRLGTMVPA